MYKHARNLEFEEAARIRDEIEQLRQAAFGVPGAMAGQAMAGARGCGGHRAAGCWSRGQRLLRPAARRKIRGIRHPTDGRQ